MRLSKIKFEESLWAEPGSGINYDQTEEVEDEIKLLRGFFPEIINWGDLAVFTAWGSYSQDHYDLNWNPVTHRDEKFLGYLHHVEQGRDIMQWSEQSAALAMQELF